MIFKERSRRVETSNITICRITMTRRSMEEIGVKMISNSTTIRKEETIIIIVEEPIIMEMSIIRKNKITENSRREEEKAIITSMLRKEISKNIELVMKLSLKKFYNSVRLEEMIFRKRAISLIFRKLEEAILSNSLRFTFRLSLRILKKSSCF